jgi:hypothetical protein
MAKTFNKFIEIKSKSIKNLFKLKAEGLKKISPKRLINGLKRNFFLYLLFSYELITDLCLKGSNRCSIDENSFQNIDAFILSDKSDR